MRVAVIALFLLIGCGLGSAFAQASDSSRAKPRVLRWTAPELLLAGTFAAGVWIDAAQTRHAMRLGYYETNPVLQAIGGYYPSNVQINAYNAAAALAVLGTTAVLPRPWRIILLTAAAVVEARQVIRNARFGLGVRF